MNKQPDSPSTLIPIIRQQSLDIVSLLWLVMRSADEPHKQREYVDAIRVLTGDTQVKIAAALHSMGFSLTHKPKGLGPNGKHVREATGETENPFPIIVDEEEDEELGRLIDEREDEPEIEVNLEDV